MLYFKYSPCKVRNSERTLVVPQTNCHKISKVNELSLGTFSGLHKRSGEFLLTGLRAKRLESETRDRSSALLVSWLFIEHLLCPLLDPGNSPESKIGVPCPQEAQHLMYETKMKIIISEGASLTSVGVPRKGKQLLPLVIEDSFRRNI